MILNIDQFISKLSSVSNMEYVLNPYSEDNEYYKIARYNLKLYLERMIISKPNSIFIGEAPGYNGCRLTGVPFTSERILLGKFHSNQIIAKDFGYKVRCIDAPRSEQSATIMWSAFERYQYYPLLWNAFPFHPYKSGNPLSNRTPDRNELEIGSSFIFDLIEMYGIKTIYSIGNTASDTLNKMGIANSRLRHPANGGKPEFIKGLEQIIGLF